MNGLNGLEGAVYRKRFGVPAILRSRLRRRGRPAVSRRSFLGLAAIFLTAGVALASRLKLSAGAIAGIRGVAPIRPPTAARDDLRFRAACIRCGLCGTVCENGCIRYFGLHEPEYGVLTPYLDLRRSACTLCMRCTEICPTGALSPLADDLETIQAKVRMGLAVVDPGRCISYQGRICGVCHDACPLPGTALRLVPKAKPQVLEQGCVGCGRCVEACPQVPTAIDVRRLS
jgi:ferredoxin-type protein NapF